MRLYFVITIIGEDTFYKTNVKCILYIYIHIIILYTYPLLWIIQLIFYTILI